jgi:hypothetical protein
VGLAWPASKRYVLKECVLPRRGERERGQFKAAEENKTTRNKSSGDLARPDFPVLVAIYHVSLKISLFFILLSVTISAISTTRSPCRKKSKFDKAALIFSFWLASWQRLYPPLAILSDWCCCCMSIRLNTVLSLGQ